jgi:large subunit ribosomal protein L18
MKSEQRIKRHRKIRMEIAGTAARPRLAVYKSNRFFTAQLIDDTKGITIASAGDIGKSTDQKKGTKTERAKEVGKAIAKLAGEKKIKKVVFDRAGFLYAGRVKAFAEAAREGGLEF